jgi:hypothetical protein
VLGTLSRSPFSQEKVRYHAKAGTIIYRSQMHPVLKRNVEVFSALDWLAAFDVAAQAGAEAVNNAAQGLTSIIIHHDTRLSLTAVV